jgi:hypothetical protein
MYAAEVTRDKSLEVIAELIAFLTLESANNAATRTRASGGCDESLNRTVTEATVVTMVTHSVRKDLMMML